MDGDTDRAASLRGGWSRPHLASFALFGLVALALLTGIALIFSTIRAEQGVREEVTRTNQTLLALRDVGRATINAEVGSSRVDLQACKLEYSIVSPK